METEARGVRSRPRSHWRALRDLGAAALPFTLATLSVALLYGALFGVDFLFGTDLKVFGVRDDATERFVFSRYGALIVKHQARVFACFLVLGAAVGAALQLIIALWQRSGAWPQHRPAHSGQTPLNLPPSPWPLRRRVVVSLVAGLLVHVYFIGRNLIALPALYAEALYERGGLGRSLMLALTHGGRGTSLVLSGLVVAVLLFALLGPLLAPRGRELLFGGFASLRRHPLRAVLGVGAIAVAVWLLKTGPSSLSPSASLEPGAVREPGRAAPERPHPSVLLIAIDSLRADRVGPAARQITPTLSALAERSVQFDAAHVTVPRTFPSLVTLLTGRYPHRHGVRTMFPTREERARVPKALPALLRPAGYTSAVVSDFAGEIFSRIELGFDRTEVPLFDAKTIVLQRSLTVHKNLLPYVSGSLGDRLFPELGSLAERADPRRLSRQTLDALRGFRGQPFFLTVFFSAAHFPYAAPAPYYRRFTDPQYRGPFLYHKPPLVEPQSAADIAQVRALYDGAVAAADDGVRVLLDGLRALGRDKDTIVIVLADHGENLYDEPGRGMGHGDHLEGDHSLHVPLLIYDPTHGFRPHRVPGLVRDLDVLPTVLELTTGAVPAGEDFDGVSLLPLLRGERDRLGLSAFSETELWFTKSGPGFSIDERLPYPDVTATTAVDARDDIAISDRYRELVTVAKHRALRTDRWKIVYRPTRSGPRYSLYDLASDPRELTDVADQRPAELAEMKAALFRIIALDPSVTIEGGYVVPR